MGLTDDSTRPNHLPTLAAPVARSAHVIQPAKGWGQIFGLGQGALASCLTRAIQIKDYPGISCSIRQASRLLVVGERATLQIIEKERAQGFHRCLSQRC